jgi:hypothetical protein
MHLNYSNFAQLGQNDSLAYWADEMLKRDPYDATLIADYTLQGWLADGKQKRWWQKCFEGRMPDKYRNDYKAALVCHALYWSIFVCAPFYAHPWLLYMVIANTVVHAVVDDLKANALKINLIQDQVLHLAQILMTFGIFELLG